MPADYDQEYVSMSRVPDEESDEKIDLSQFDLIADEETIRRLSQAMYTNDAGEVGRILAGVYLDKPGDSSEIKRRRRELIRQMSSIRQELVKLSSYPPEPPPEIGGVPTVVVFRKRFGRYPGTIYSYSAVRSVLGWSTTGNERTPHKNLTWKALVDFTRQAEKEWPTIYAANSYSPVE